MKHGVRFILVMVLCFLVFSTLRAQRHRTQLRSVDRIAYRTSRVSFGVKGGLNHSFLHYTELHDQQQKPGLSGDISVFMEWRLVDRLSVGVGFSFACRNAQLEFNTPYLTGYSTTAITNIAYRQSVRGLGWNLPFTWYFGKPEPWLDTHCRFYAFAGPSLFLALDGSMTWKRTHLVDNQIVDEYNVPVSSSSSYPFDYGVRMGVGMAFKQKTRHSHYVLKGDLSFYYGIPDTFSDAERRLAVSHFYGLGDVQHEALGSRHFRQVTFSLSLSLPLRKRPHGACHINSGGI